MPVVVAAAAAAAVAITAMPQPPHYELDGGKPLLDINQICNNCSCIQIVFILRLNWHLHLCCSTHSVVFLCNTSTKEAVAGEGDQLLKLNRDISVV